MTDKVPVTPSEPRTEAGRALLDAPDVLLMMSGDEIVGLNEGELELQLAAIEREAIEGAASPPDSTRFDYDALTLRRIPTVYEREGRVYVRPVGRGVHFTDGDEDYIERVIEDMAAKASGQLAPFGWSGYAHLKIRIEVTPEAKADRG